MAEKLEYTCEDSVGPYYSPAFLDGDRQDLTNYDDYIVRPDGTPILLRGRVLDSEGRPVTSILVETWQADAGGRRRTETTKDDPRVDPWFDGFSRHYCPDGTFELRTIMPGATVPCRESSAARAPYLTVNLFMDGTERLATQIFFSDRAENAADPLLLSLPEALRPRLIAQRLGEDVDGMPAYAIDIRLRCADETPFFDDRFS